MHAVMLMTGSGPLVILTSHASPLDPALLEKLEGKGISKFIAFELPLDLVQARYGTHFFVVARDLRESDDLRVLDYEGSRAFRLFTFEELGPPVFVDRGVAVRKAA
jgi:hypothetical protein